MNENLSPIEKLLNEENTENITLYDSDDNQIEFEQIALIPLNEKMYVILSPVSELPGIGEDEGLVFMIDENEDGDQYLALVEDGETVDAVFEIYESLIADGETDCE